jgi:transposase-like protein
MTPESIVIRLRAEGYRHSRDDCDIGWRAVEQILLRTGHTINRSPQPRRVHPDQAPHDNEWWLADLAAELGVTLGTIHHWRQQARLTGRQETYPPHRWILHADPAKLAELRTHLDHVRGRTTRVHPRFAETTDHITQVQPA